MRTLFLAPEAVVITGTLKQSRYLSRVNGQSVERQNTTYVVVLEEVVNVAPPSRKQGKTPEALPNIERVEIGNTSDQSFPTLVGKRLRLEGSLHLITPTRGYYRQTSTPVSIRVAKVEVLE